MVVPLLVGCYTAYVKQKRPGDCSQVHANRTLVKTKDWSKQVSMRVELETLVLVCFCFM